MSAQTVACRWVRDWTPTVDCGSTVLQAKQAAIFGQFCPEFRLFQQAAERCLLSKFRGKRMRAQ